jgi:hypothetical protein
MAGKTPADVTSQKTCLPCETADAVSKPCPTRLRDTSLRKSLFHNSACDCLAASLLAIECRHEGAAMRLATTLFLSTFTISAVVSATPVPSIQFPDGNVLNIQGVVGSGPNTAYLAIDFSNNAPPGPAFAWQYNYTSSATELDMLNAVGAADNALTVVPDPTYGYDFIDNFNYGANIGSADPFPASGSYSFWASDIGQYDSGSKSVNWVFAPDGADLLNLGDLYDDGGNLLASGVEDLIYGWTINGEFQTTNLDPDLPETAVPEPATLGLLVLAGASLLQFRRRSRLVLP